MSSQTLAATWFLFWSLSQAGWGATEEIHFLKCQVGTSWVSHLDQSNFHIGFVAENDSKEKKKNPLFLNMYP